MGVFLYHLGAMYPRAENEIAKANKFAEQLTGTYNGADSLLPNIYGFNGKDHNKPVIVPETAPFTNQPPVAHLRPT